MKFEFTSTYYTEEYMAEIDQILEILGHPEALVTDESTISDFAPSEEIIKELNKKIGQTVKKSDLLIYVAKIISCGGQ